MRSLLCVAALCCGVPVVCAAETQVIPLRSGNGRVQFRIPHLLSSVDGSFGSFRGQIVYDPEDTRKDSVEWVVNVRSVDTGNVSRDAHLTSPEYFNPDKYPTIQFVSDSVEAVDDAHLSVTGKFTLCGVTKTLKVPVVLDGKNFDSQFSILRSDYGFTAGSPLVGDQVDIHIHFLAQKSWFPAPR